MENICIVADIQIRQIYYILGTVGIFIVAVIPTVPIFFTHGMASMYIGGRYNNSSDILLTFDALAPVMVMLLVTL